MIDRAKTAGVGQTTLTTLEMAAEKHIKVLPPKKHDSIPSEDSIINNIGGGDATAGSCASVGLIYAANKAGYDVKDFRGGSSRKLLSHRIVSMAGDLGGAEYRGPNDILCCHDMFESMEEGKEYYMAVARHAAIIRKNGGKVEFLELQSSTENGWHPLTDDRLVSRFKAKRNEYGRGILIDTEKMVGTEAFGALLGIINTDASKQKKGDSGYAK